MGVAGFANAARMLYAGRVQLVVEDERVARYHLGRELSDLGDALEFLARPLAENPLHVLARHSHPQHRLIASRVDRAVRAMKADGCSAAILRSHGL